ncbi:MAG TPA: GGDEF domain-containing protein [Acidimicrobiales bacterium]|nr:GGDEF domain-containing protein [Acidimicrobiales bacterium]
MPTLSHHAIAPLRVICAVAVVLLLATGAIGVAAADRAAATGRLVSRDQMVTEQATASAVQAVADAYAAGEVALGGGPAGQGAARALSGTLLRAADAALFDLQRDHASDDGAEGATAARVSEEWAVLRERLDAVATGAAGSTPSGQTASTLSSAYDPIDTDMQALLAREPAEAAAATAADGGALRHDAWIIGGLVAAGALSALLAMLVLSRRVRRALQPVGEQAEFSETLQLATDEVEAHRLLQRHLERTVPGATAVVLNRNNSADRLEAVTGLPAGSRLRDALAGAEPTSCLAVRSAGPHSRGAGPPRLLECAVCSACDGASTCAPLTVGGEVIGAVLLERDRPLETHEQQRTLESVSQAAPVLANLRNLAVAELRAATDGLTGLPNKRAVTDTAKRLFAQAVATGSPLALVVLDLDHFKQLNDHYGHPVGDQALAAVGTVLRGNLRGTDFAGRNGGEEFAILLPGVHAAPAAELAERVRRGIAEIRLPGTEVRLTASFGVAAYPEHATTLDRLERLADGALYVGKQSGRDRTVVARSADDPVPGAAPTVGLPAPVAGS